MLKNVQNILSLKNVQNDVSHFFFKMFKFDSGFSHFYTDLKLTCKILKIKFKIKKFLIRKEFFRNSNKFQNRKNQNRFYFFKNGFSIVSEPLDKFDKVLGFEKSIKFRID